MVRVRFAPSPTGRLHVGNIYIALNNWLFAKKRNGRFLLRLDDTDLERSTEAFAQGIRDDLTWLGLAWDEYASQSTRLAAYDAAAAKLKASGRLYPCYESAEELALKRKIQLGQGKPPVYDRAALKLNDADRAKLEAEGKRPHWRFMIEAHESPTNSFPPITEVRWDDLVRGAQYIDVSSQSDPVLIREGGTYLYTLPSVVDDVDLGISHVIRGNDHVTNTATQIQIFRALGATVPVFAHLPLLVDSSGEGLSKRLGSLSIGQLRDEGLEPMAVNAYLACIGTGDPVEPKRSLSELLATHDLGKFGKSSPRFDVGELHHINSKLVHRLSYADAQKHLAAAGLGHIDSELWEAARSNVEKVDEIDQWYRICRDLVAPQIVDGEFAKQAATLLPAEPWDGETWKRWTEAVKTATGKKGKELYMPLRLALTSLDHGPELKVLLPLIGRDRAQKRLNGETA